jgi:hypothetical protein
MAEAAIGLSLMAFVFILVVYIFYMCDYQIRSEMAARYAAWYQGASSGTAASTTQVDAGCFFQTGQSTVSEGTPDNIGNLLTGANSSQAQSYTPDENGPYMVIVKFGVSDPNSTSNPFPFSLLATQVPFMTNSMFANFFSVSSQCQWDEIGNTWTSPGAAFQGIISTVESSVESFL